MHIPKKTPTRQATVAGVIVEVPTPFADGHACTANEAAALNQLLIENVRNNTATRVKKAVETGADPQGVVNDYIKEYEFGVRGAVVRDPVEAETISIAVSNVEKAIKSKGLKLGDFTKAKIKELALDAMTRHPEWRETAKEMVARRASALSDVAAELGL